MAPGLELENPSDHWSHEECLDLGLMLEGS